MASGTRNGSPSSGSPGDASFARKDHAQRDQEQHDAARDAEGLLLEPKESQKVVAEEEEHEQHAVCEQNLAHQHDAPPLCRNGLENGQERRDVPDRVHDEQQGDDGGGHVH